MTFVYPQLFWALVIPFVLFAFLIVTNKERIARIFDTRVLSRLRADDAGMPQRVRNIILLLGIFLMIVALARPVKELGEKHVEVQGLTLLSALDISGSMRSKDIYPNRLEFAKKKMGQFFDVMPSDEIGVMAFAYNAFVLAPFTSDKETLKRIIEGVDDSYISMGSTDFDAMGSLAARLLEKKKPKILVVFTDGGDEEAIRGLGDILEENGIDLYVVLVGTKKGAPVLDENGKPMMKKDGTIAITQRNDALGELAKAHGGAYIIAGNGKKDVEALANVIHSKYRAARQGEVKVKQRVEYFYYPLALGLILLLIGFSSLPRFEKKIRGAA
jgi:Ca-activated chloride channel family protein